TDKIAKAHRDEIDKAVKKFFLDNYKTEVIVHNTVGAIDGATVFVESVGEPHFYTYAIVPVDIEEEKVLTDQVWCQEGQVEYAIMGGLYALIFEEELATLDRYLESVVEKYPVVGVRKEANENTGGSGYMTPYYYLTIFDKTFEPLYEMYITNPKRPKEEWKNALNMNELDPKMFRITIHLHMAKPNTEPDKEIFNQVILDLENMDGLSPGWYSVFLHDNNVNKKSAIATKDNSLEKSEPDYIIKQ
ncbi:DUF1672 family protein, partial [Bacillus aquiflavi]